jgi:hypothetical protein
MVDRFIMISGLVARTSLVVPANQVFLCARFFFNLQYSRAKTRRPGPAPAAALLSLRLGHDRPAACMLIARRTTTMRWTHLCNGRSRIICQHVVWRRPPHLKISRDRKSAAGRNGGVAVTFTAFLCAECRHLYY